jgi:hypothetical protein
LCSLFRNPLIQCNSPTEHLNQNWMVQRHPKHN